MTAETIAKALGGCRTGGTFMARSINITTIQTFFTPEKPGAEPSAPSASSAPMPKSNPANGFAAQSVRTVARDADGSGNGNAPTVRANPLRNNAGTAADGADANPPPQSGSKKTGAPGWSTRL